jgi:hypothetical protein
MTGEEFIEWLGTWQAWELGLAWLGVLASSAFYYGFLHAMFRDVYGDLRAMVRRRRWRKVVEQERREAERLRRREPRGPEDWFTE